MPREDHKYWMKKAIDQALEGDTPYGAVVVNNNEQHIAAYNTVELDGSTAHAEMNVIQKLNDMDFKDAIELTLYSTVEPCPMCMGAIIWTGIGAVVYGASIDDAAKHYTQIHISAQEVANKSWYDLNLVQGIEREKCLSLFH